MSDQLTRDAGAAAEQAKRADAPENAATIGARGPQRLELDPAAARRAPAPATAPAAAGPDSAGTAPAGAPAFCCPAAALLRELVRPPKSWFRRHPILFFLLLLFSLFLLLNIAGVIAAYVTSQGPFAGARLGVVRVEGMILDSEPVLKWCKQLEDDPSVRGVLVYVNSPGGAVVPAQEIYAGLRRLAAKKPVLTYMSSTAASGGYYAGMAGHYIVASPSTLTGSIGVRMELTEMKELFDWLGIHAQSLASGELKEAGTPFRPLRDDERAYLQDLVQDMHNCFVEDVAAARKLPLDKVKSLADGRAYTGRQALGLGLVDELGDSALAWELLKKRSGLDGEPDEYLDGPPKEKSWLWSLLSGSLAELDRLRAESTRPAFGFYY
ncbi:MAG: signal peptide peptidase SppA [Deltaproteobacteria bacterium]|jgi:protease-4|nr:signal peptide peptidase SppA [Deltaproteobacteria bacterium]